MAHWRHVGPSPESYSRVSDAERFRPLHELALSLVARLIAEYVVEERHTFDMLPDMPAIEYARPPVTLVPATPVAAPIGFAFTPFPGVFLRCGRWLVEYFPACGCDACSETAAGEGDRLRDLVNDVVAGRFREELAIPLLARPRLRWELGEQTTVAGRRAAMRVIPRDEARVLASRGRGRMEWQPWQLRRS